MYPREKDWVPAEEVFSDTSIAIEFCYWGKKKPFYVYLLHEEGSSLENDDAFQ